MAFQRHYSVASPFLRRGLFGRWEGSPPASAKDPNFGGAVRFMYNALLTKMVEKARFVAWYSEKEKRFLPGLFCPDWKTAAFATLFVNEIRVCPKCGVLFVPNDSKHRYCIPSHGVSYRQARSRWRKGQKAK